MIVEQFYLILIVQFAI